MAQVQRREAEAQHVRGAEVADHAAGDQRLDDGVAELRVREADLAAAQRVLGRRDQRELRAAGLHLVGEQPRQGQRLGAQRGHAAAGLGREHGVDAALQRGHRQHWRGAAQVARDARRRAVAGRELERRGVPHPAGQGLPEALGVARVHPDEGRRAGAAVEVLVAAAHRHVGAVAVQGHRQRAGAVRQVPHRQRAGRVCGVRQRGHVVQAAAAVVDLGEHQHRGVGAQQRRDLRGRVGQPQLAAALRRQRLGDVEVGREVAAFADDHAASRVGLLRDGQRGAEHLEQVDAGRVGDHQLAGPGADQARDLVADALRQIDPAGAVPAADQIAPPLVAQDLLHARRGGPGQRAERIAVQVDQARRQLELLAQRGQRIGGVERQRVVPGHLGSSLSTARTGDAQAVVSFSGSAISS